MFRFIENFLSKFSIFSRDFSIFLQIIEKSGFERHGAGMRSLLSPFFGLYSAQFCDFSPMLLFFSSQFCRDFEKMR